VLAPELQGKDLRISSQTGSGKTVAIGLALRDDLRAMAADEPAEPGPVRYGGDDRDTKAHPRAIVVTPTRELAKQVQEELAWLYAPLGAKVSSVTGGGGYRDELRSFRARPAIIVGTPGRLLDHLKRGAIDASATGTLVLDEADRMLDLGFREDLVAILAFAPKEHRTHLVSATFPREVKALADRVQSDPVSVEGTPLGTANLDIEHLVHLVQPRERFAAIVNLLLETPNRGPEDGAASSESRGRAPTLIFARTRADVAELAGMLSDEGFKMAMLSGEMEQAERNRALAAFKKGHVDALVATDVAARGIDVQDVARVIHAESPDDADAYTHRSGRTGRAGKKGTSSLLATPSELPRVTALLQRARVEFRFAPIPTAESIRETRDAGLLAELTADFVQGEPIDPRSLALAERIIGSSEPARAVARLVAIAQKETHAQPREVTPVAPPPPRAPGAARRSHTAGPGAGSEQGFVAFRVSWGQAHGASAPRLVAAMCRRGKIDGRDIGAIRVGRTSSVVEVSENVAADFERAASKPDPRDPRVHIRRWSEEPVRGDRDREQGRDREREQDRSRDRRPPPQDRREAMEDVPEVREVPKDRASRAVPKDRPSVPKDRPSVPKDRPSVPKDRPSVPKDRPSRAVVKDKPSVPADRPSVKDRPSVPKERPSARNVDRAAPKDRPSARASKEAPATSKSPRPHPPKPQHRPDQKPYHPKPHHSKPDVYSSRPRAHGPDAPPEKRAAKSEDDRGPKKPWSGPSRGPKPGDRSGPPWRGGNARPKRGR
jgi:ATP-dependent RNA helicase DeaD